MVKLTPGVSFWPIAQGGLDERQRRHRGRVGSKDARAQVQVKNARRREDCGALVVVETTLRTDKEADAAVRARAFERMERTAQFRLLVAEDEQPLGRPAFERFRKGLYGRDLRNPDHAALLASLDRVGAQTLQIDAIDLGVTGDDRPQPARPHLD